MVVVHEYRPAKGFTQMTPEAVNWFTRAPGKALRVAERPILSQACRDLRGFHLLVIGSLGPWFPPAAADLGQIWYLSEPGGEAGLPSERLVLSALDAWPVATESLDAVLLIHGLEFSESPRETLRECWRCLRPGGRLVLVSTNPMSLTGFRMGIRLGQKKLLRLHRLEDWLSLLGLETERRLSGCSWLNHMNPLVRWLNAWRLPAGSIVVHVCVKRTPGHVRPLRQRFARLKTV
jgi:hypothetical protein